MSRRLGSPFRPSIQISRVTITHMHELLDVRRELGQIQGAHCAQLLLCVIMYEMRVRKRGEKNRIGSRREKSRPVNAPCPASASRPAALA